ncbi:CsbD family protein [Methylopila henanensis]|uniref:CsbD family protein n=1 Tax=Methylopila henanensis TaxID=873516 RepID=A0ABW4K5K7_9HYPH
MNRDRFEGSVKQLKGKLQRAWGRMVGDHALELRGRAAEIAGSAQASFGRAMAGARASFAPRRRIGA